MARTVEDPDGNRYVLEEHEEPESRVFDPASGTRQQLPTDDLTPVDEPPQLAAMARSLGPGSVFRFDGVHDERSLGLVLELERRGPSAVRTLLDMTTLCESDLHGYLGELQAGGLIREETVHGERGYALTETAMSRLSELRNG